MLCNTGNTAEIQELKQKKKKCGAFSDSYDFLGHSQGKQKKPKRRAIWHKEQNITRSADRRHHGYLICELTCLGVKLLFTQVMTNYYCESLNF